MPTTSTLRGVAIMENRVAAVIIWLFLIVIRVAFVLMGPIVVSIALPFSKSYDSDRKPTWSGWHLIRLPWWAYPWDNPRDGTLGDVHGAYWTRDYPKIFDKLDNKWRILAKQWWWLVVRNPANGLRFVPLLSCDVRTAKITLLEGSPVVADKIGYSWRWQFVKATQMGLFPYYGFYYVSKPLNGKAWVIRLGHKIEPKHSERGLYDDDPEKALKGFTFRISHKELRK